MARAITAVEVFVPSALSTAMPTLKIARPTPPRMAGGWRSERLPATGAIKAGGFDGALLFPNSFHTAWTARSAGIRERWGFATDVRRLLLTRHAVPPVRVHQAGYYQHLTTALGFAPGPLIPRVEVSASQREHAAAILRTAGWDGERRLVVLAVDGDPDLVRVEAQAAVRLRAGDQLPGQRDGAFLEVVAEAEVAHHLEEGVMAAGVADIFEIVVLAAGAHALLARRGPAVPVGRYVDTRVAVFPGSGLIIRGHDHHAVHHLFPRIPHYRLREFWEQSASDLVSKGVRAEGRAIGATGPITW